MIRSTNLAWVIWAALLLSGAQTGVVRADDAPLTTVDSVDLERYAGDWFELARLPAWFQRRCLQSQATYRVVAADRMSVVNSCPKANGDTERATGEAVVVDPTTNAKLTVQFDNWFSRLFPSLTTGDYWIVHLDPQYRWVIVGTPSRKYLWILARETAVAPEVFERLVAIAAAEGFAVDELIVH